MSRLPGLLGNKVILTLLIVAALVIAPRILSTHGVLVLTEILIMSLFAMSFNLLFGYAGLLSFGHAGFFGAGAYFCVFCLMHWSDSVWLALLAGLGGAAGLALVIGRLCVRRDKIYFAMLTLCFGMMLYTAAYNWRSVTGGSDGLGGFTFPVLKVLGWEAALTNPEPFFYIVVLVSAAAAVVLMRIVSSPLGLLLAATRENHQRLVFVGADVCSVRLVAFVLAAALAGVSGALFALFNRIASPEMLHWSFSAKAVLITVLGGSGVFLGPVVGAAMFFALEHFITSYTPNWMIFPATILIVLVLLFPEGVCGTLARLVSRHERGSGNV